MITPAAALGPATEPAHTLEEWATWPEDDPGELVDGRVEEEEVPDYVHEVVVAWLTRLFGNWLSGRRGFVAGSDAKFAVSPRRGRKPDATVYLPGGAVPPARGLVTVPPEIAVEVVSATPRDARRDRVEKLGDYAAFGIRWYWIVDPGLRTLEVLELNADRLYVHVVGASAGVVAEVPGCPGLAVDLDALWAEVDALEAGAAAPAEGPAGG